MVFTGWYRDQDQDFNCKVSGQDQDLNKTNSGGLDFQDHGLEATRLAMISSQSVPLLAILASSLTLTCLFLNK